MVNIRGFTESSKPLSFLIKSMLYQSGKAYRIPIVSVVVSQSDKAITEVRGDQNDQIIYVQLLLFAYYHFFL